MTSPLDAIIRDIMGAEPRPIPPELGDVQGMIDAARQHAERVLVGDKGAELMPVWCVLTKTGQSAIIATPFFGEESKGQIAEAMRDFMRRVGAVRYTMASEAWLASGKSPDGRPPKDRDDRIEVVMICGCGKGESQMRTFEIIRDWQTGVVTELKPMEGDLDVVSGRFSGLLEDS